MKKRKLSTYSKVYLSVVSVFMILLVIAAIVLWTVLGAYEDTHPKYVASDVFNKYFVTMDFAGILQECSPEIMKFESAEKVNAGVKEKYDPASFNYFSVSSDEKGNEQYAVTSDNKRIAYFTLSPTKRQASYGFKYYALSDVELFVGDFGDVKVKVPKNYILRINGVKVGDSFITEKDIPGDSCKYLLENGVKYDVYTVKGLMFEPEITVETVDGAKSEVAYSESDKLYVANVVYDEKLKAEYSDLVIKMTKAYANYLAKDLDFGGVAKYLDKNREIYKRVRSIETVWATDHESTHFKDESATEFYQYAEGVFSCRVKVTHVWKRSGYPDHVENIDLIFYLHKVDGQYLIFEIVSNN